MTGDPPTTVVHRRGVIDRHHLSCRPSTRPGFSFRLFAVGQDRWWVGLLFSGQILYTATCSSWPGARQLIANALDNGWFLGYPASRNAVAEGRQRR